MNENCDKKNNSKRNLRIFRFAFFIAAVFLFCGLSVVVWDKYLFPYLRSNEKISQWGFLKRGMENTLVINKTEQITINDTQSISKFTEKSASSVVEIAMRKKKNANSESFINSVETTVSGVIVAADGLIVSYDNDLFSRNFEYKVFMSDGRNFEARFLFSDPYSNLVFFKIENISNLPVIEFVSDQDIKAGSKIVVIGKNGFDSGNSFRLTILEEFDGALSLAGNLATSEKMQGVYRVDHDFRERRSENLLGGAVVDYNGNSVGILGARKNDQNLDFFVVPPSVIQNTVSNFIEKGEIRRGSLGVYYILNSKENAYFRRSPIERGATLYSASLQQGLAVLSGSAAEKAGLRIQDVVLSVNGEEIGVNQNLAYLISKHKPGETVILKIVREGKEMEVKAVLQ